MHSENVPTCVLALFNDLDSARKRLFVDAMQLINSRRKDGLPMSDDEIRKLMDTVLNDTDTKTVQ